MMQLALDRRTGDVITADMSKSRAVAIFGKRGSGKSYTLGRIIEQVYRLYGEERLIIVVDPLAVYWTTAIPIDGAEPIPVRVLIPGEPSQALGPLADVIEQYAEIDRLWLNPSDIGPDAWCALFDFKLNEPLGILLYRSVYALQQSGAAWFLSDLLQVAEADEVARDSTKEALANRLLMAETWGVFSPTYQPLIERFKPGCVNVVDVSMFEPGPQSIRNLLVKLMCEQLFRARFESRRLETVGRPASVPPIFLAIDEAHDFCPADKAALAHDPLIRWAKEGRQPGLSLAVATQQPSALDFALVSQCDLLVIHHLTLGDDVKLVARLAAAYAEDLPAFLKGVRDPGEAVIVDDATERVVVGKVLPREAKHGGGEALRGEP